MIRSTLFAGLAGIIAAAALGGCAEPYGTSQYYGEAGYPPTYSAADYYYCPAFNYPFCGPDFIAFGGGGFERFHHRDHDHDRGPGFHHDRDFDFRMDHGFDHGGHFGHAGIAGRGGAGHNGMAGARSGFGGANESGAHESGAAGNVVMPGGGAPQGGGGHGGGGHK